MLTLKLSSRWFSKGSNFFNFYLILFPEFSFSLLRSSHLGTPFTVFLKDQIVVWEGKHKEATRNIRGRWREFYKNLFLSHWPVVSSSEVMSILRMANTGLGSNISDYVEEPRYDINPTLEQFSSSPNYSLLEILHLGPFLLLLLL